MTVPGDSSASDTRYQPGTKVELRTGFDGTWSTGFVVVETLDAGYRVKRRSDGDVLPVVFPSGEVRRERKNSMWWY